MADLVSSAEAIRGVDVAASEVPLQALTAFISCDFLAATDHRLARSVCELYAAKWDADLHAAILRNLSERAR
jgi:hypothetical protein